MTQTYIKNPDGSFSPAPSLPIPSSVLGFAAAAANEINPAIIHDALTSLGSQVPSVIPIALAGATAMSPEALNAVTGVVGAALSGNPVAIVGSVITAGLFAYTTFSKTQLKGITDEQIQSYIAGLTHDQLLSLLGTNTTSTGQSAAGATITSNASSGTS